MDTESEMLAKMRGCRIQIFYAGLDHFKLFTREHPDAALRIMWDVLTSGGDPGRDDGMLCFELLTNAVGSVGRERVEDLILSNWNDLSDEIRRNITHGAASEQVFSEDFATKLFDLPSTRVEQRHHIVAGLAGGDYRNCTALIKSLAARIGPYEEPHRQDILNRFIENIHRFLTD